MKKFTGKSVEKIKKTQGKASKWILMLNFNFLFSFPAFNLKIVFFFFIFARLRGLIKIDILIL